MELLDKPITEIAVYAPFYAKLAELEKTNESIVFDYEGKNGNKEARSHIFSLRKANAELDRARKAAKEESLKLGRAIDSEAKEISARISAMIDVHQVKIDEIEQRETDRIASIKAKIVELESIKTGLSIQALENYLVYLSCYLIDESFAEFSAEAAIALSVSCAKHREMLDAQVKAEADAAELAELRKQQAETKKRERDEAIAKAAAEKATREAAEREAVLIAQAEADRLAAVKREADLLAKAQAEKAAAIKAEQDKAAALIAERERHQAQLMKEQIARENDAKHKGKINREAMAAFLEFAPALDENEAKHIIKLIACGKIPHISINY